MPRQPEGKLVAKAKKWLTQEKGARCFKIQGQEDSFQEVGIPDVLVCWRGQFIALEFKQPGENPSKVQAHVMRSIQNAGGTAECIRSMEDLRQLWGALEVKADL